MADSRNALSFGFMLPAAALLLVFLTYPLGLGIWLGFTDARIGRPGIFIGIENYQYLSDDAVFWLSVFNTLLYTISASILKFALGLWLALILNQNLPIKSFFRAIILLPFVAITLLAGLQTIPQSLYEAATLDGASRSQLFRFVTLPLLTPIIAITMTFSVLFTFTDFQLIYVLTRGGPVNATHLMATLSFQRGISGGQLGEGAAIAVAMIPFLLAAILFSYFGLQRRKWQQGGGD
ncbi:MAG: sugar ABC transporter permease [Mesorhizobium sp.]|nr:MAG: sugar ABC transporter permease [Mesorhizobium sp.]